jgi:protein O-GlcNAc transferase
VNRGEFSAQPQNVSAADAARKLREAIALHQQGRIADAERRYSEILKLYPNHPDALHFLGVLEFQHGHHGRALELIDRSLAVNARNAAAHYNRANTLRDMARPEDSVRGYDSALALNPKHVSALINRAAVLRTLDRHADALEGYDRAIALAPGEANAHFGRGDALTQLNRFDAAIDAFDRAIALAPAKPEFLTGRGHALCRAGRHSDALTDFEKAIATSPKHAGAFAGRAIALMELRRFADAVESYDRAMALDPAWIEMHYGRGSALIELGRHDEAIAGFRRLLALRPDYPYALGMLVHAQKMSCDWSDPSSEAALVEQVSHGKKAASPFAMLPVSDSSTLQCARTVMRDKFEPGREPLWRGDVYRHDRVRLAYLSADLRGHPVGHLMASVVEAHDRAAYEVTAIAYTPDDGSALRQRLKKAFDRFIETGALSDFDIARQMREMEIDIAVDLTGLTANCRPGILTFRPAPVQVNYLGYAGSMGSSRIDYVIGDVTVIPEAHEQFYDEKIARLPVPFLPLDAPPASKTVNMSRADAVLPEHRFVFASFNNSYKFNAQIFGIWMRVLSQVEGSVLWLAEPNSIAARNLKDEAHKRGVAPERIVFAPRLPTIDQHFARLGLADLFLDTLPYNAHTTAADALRAGLPVLTCRGKSFAGRVASSVLEAVGLPELIAETPEEYENRALALAQERHELATLKARLDAWRAGEAHNALRHFVRNLEAAYRYMWSRAQQKLPPESFAVERT